LATAGRLFLKQPSILHKSSSLLQQRIAALQALLGQQRGVDVVTAFPALLNLQPEVLRERWRLLQQVNLVFVVAGRLLRCASLVLSACAVCSSIK
jgi:hypothetical protein